MKTEEELMEQNRLIIADTKKRFKELMARNTRPVDDVQYNQEWWEWYCNEHKLDVKTGKSIRGSSSPRPSNYTLF